MSLPERDRFGRQWLAFWILCGLAAAGTKLFSARFASAPPPVAVKQGSVDWFLVVKMPPVTAQYESGIDVMLSRYDEWLDSLRRAGFQPMLLSEALARVDSGRGLPERAVVAVFEPGLRRTREIVEPVFRRRGWPAVWLTDKAAMRSGHREYITFRDARKMTASGWWDVGYSRRSGGCELKSRSRRMSLGGKRPVWSATEGTFALNRGARRDNLNVLTINQDWLGREVVDRLRAELPYERGTCLAKAVIHGRDWGVAGETAAGEETCPAFDLEAAGDRRDTRLHWLGTAGVKSFRLNLAVRKVVGELRVHLLRDEVAKKQVTIVLGEKLAHVDADGQRLHTVSLGAKRAPIRAVIILEGDRLLLQLNGGAVWSSPLLKTQDKGLLMLQASEKMRGVARAEGIRMTFDPKPTADLAGQP